MLPHARTSWFWCDRCCCRERALRRAGRRLVGAVVGVVVAVVADNVVVDRAGVDDFGQSSTGIIAVGDGLGGIGSCSSSKSACKDKPAKFGTHGVTPRPTHKGEMIQHRANDKAKANTTRI